MVLVALSVLLWGFFHSLFASFEAKELARRWLGAWIARYYRLAYNLFALLSFVPVLVILFLTPDRQLYEIPLPWSALMMVGQFVALVVLVVGFLQVDAREFLGLRQVAGSLSSRGGELLTSGLYHYVRHPLYSAGLVFIWLIPIMTTNVLAINLALSLYVVCGAWLEEGRLLREYGDAYAAYQRRTPMLVPFLRFRRNK